MITKNMTTLIALIIGLALFAPAVQQLSAQEAPPLQRGTDTGQLGGPRGPHGGPGQRRGAGSPLERVQQFVEKMQQEDPENYERLMALREENPEQFRQELRKMLTDRMQKRPGRGPRRMTPEDQETVELAQLYQKAETDAEKDAIRGKLQVAVGKAYDARLTQQEEMLERMRERLQELEERVATRKESRDEMIENRVEQLTTDPTLRW